MRETNCQKEICEMASKRILSFHGSYLKLYHIEVLRRLIHKVEVDVDSVLVHFFVGEQHYERELALAGSFQNNASNSLTLGTRRENRTLKGCPGGF